MMNHSTDFAAPMASLRSVAEAFAGADHELYLVGGIVRDTVLGLEANSPDIDATTSASPEVIKQLLGPLASSVWTQGERFGTIGARVGPHDVEITTFRAEDYDPTSRKPAVAFGQDLHDDLARRDFTINAMAVSVIDGTLHDPFGGLADLEARLLKTPLDPVVSFSDDPLRMLRAARFIARFDLTADQALRRAAEELAPRLDIISRERVHDELERLLAVEAPRRGFDFLDQSRLLGRMFGFESDRAEVEESLRLASAPVASTSVRVARRRVGLLFPHGETKAKELLKTLRYSTDDQRHTALAVALLSSLNQRQASDSGVRGLIADAKGQRGVVDDVLAVGSMCDATSRHAADLAQLLASLEESEDLTPGRPPIDGALMMATFGIAPGPQIGRAVAYLEQRRIERGPMSEQEALDELSAWGELGSPA